MRLNRSSRRRASLLEDERFASPRPMFRHFATKPTFGSGSDNFELYTWLPASVWVTYAVFLMGWWNAAAAVPCFYKNTETGPKLLGLLLTEILLAQWHFTRPFTDYSAFFRGLFFDWIFYAAKHTTHRIANRKIMERNVSIASATDSRWAQVTIVCRTEIVKCSQLYNLAITFVIKGELVLVSCYDNAINKAPTINSCGFQY